MYFLLNKFKKNPVPNYSCKICLQRTVVLSILLLLFSGKLHSQDMSDALRNYERGRLEDVREALFTLEARYYDTPEYIFLKAVFEEDAEQAYVLFRQVNENFPDNPIFELVLWRMCQYNYAKGLYVSCNDMLVRFMNTFPDSDKLSSARSMMSKIEDKLGAEQSQPVIEREEPTTVYTIQIAAFGSRAGAERGLNYYKKLGISSAYSREHRVGRQLLFKIWVGEYRDRDEARDYAEELMRRYRLPAYTIIEINK